MNTFKSLIISAFLLLIGISLNANKPADKHIKGEVLCRIHQWSDTSLLKNHLLQFTIEILSEDLNILCLHFDPKIANAYQVIQTLNESFSTIITDVQLNHKTYLRSIRPNDARYANQQLFWELINAHNAWTKATGGVTVQGDTIVLAMIDDGIDTTHLDIQKNIWRNHNEIPNDGIDNDANGYIDDYFGWNEFDNNGKLIEKDERARHGTPVAGLMGADGNNDSGITGANWNVKILTVLGGSTEEADNIRAFEYVRKMKQLYLETDGKKGAFIVGLNCSWGLGGAFPTSAPLWCAYYDTLGAYGISTVAATANSGVDVAIAGDLPSLCTSDHLLVVTNVVASTDTKRQQAGFNKEHVDLGSPGEGSYSLCAYSQGGCSSPYASFGGTSGATPIVCGLFGLIYNYGCDSLIQLAKTNPKSASLLVNDMIKNGTDSNSSLKGLTSTGGRINYENALIEVEKWCQAINQPVDTEQVVKTAKVNIYPNPSLDQIKVEATNSIQSYKIYNLNGAIIQSKSLSSTKSHLIEHHLPSGMYIIYIQLENQQKAIRLQVY